MKELRRLVVQQVSLMRRAKSFYRTLWLQLAIHFPSQNMRLLALENLACRSHVELLKLENTQ